MIFVRFVSDNLISVPMTAMLTMVQDVDCTGAMRWRPPTSAMSYAQLLKWAERQGYIITTKDVAIYNGGFRHTLKVAQPTIKARIERCPQRSVCANMSTCCGYRYVTAECFRPWR